MAVLFITHDLGLVGEIADRVIVMRHGEVREEGEAAQVLGARATPIRARCCIAGRSWMSGRCGCPSSTIT
jgi:ABC-type glutathione transport system ATPase component